MRSGAVALACALIIGCATGTPEERAFQRQQAAALRTAKMEHWCARRGQIFVGESYGKIGAMRARGIECRAPATEEERQIVFQRAR